MTCRVELIIPGNGLRISDELQYPDGTPATGLVVTGHVLPAPDSLIGAALKTVVLAEGATVRSKRQYAGAISNAQLEAATALVAGTTYYAVVITTDYRSEAVPFDYDFEDETVTVP